jgi:hypothetical protein
MSKDAREVDFEGLLEDLVSLSLDLQILEATGISDSDMDDRAKRETMVARAKKRCMTAFSAALRSQPPYVDMD